MAIRASDIARMESKDMSRWAPRAKQTLAAMPDPQFNESFAGDALRLLSEKMPEKELGSAYEHAVDMARYFNEVDNDLIGAGVPASEFRGLQQLQVPTLRNGVPAPYVDKSTPGIERRIHTAFDDRGEIGGFYGNNGVLVTEFGDSRTAPVNLEGNKHASEYVQNHILQLMGEDVIPANMVNQQGIDFQVRRGDKIVGIDGQIKKQGEGMPVQIYTKLIPEGGNYGRYGEGAGYHGVRDDVRALVKAEMSTGKDVISAVESLVGKGVLPNDEYRIGKALKKDQGYEEVIMPEYSKVDAARNRADDAISMPPMGVEQYNLQDTLPAIRKLTERDVSNRPGDRKALRFKPNAGHGRNGDNRAQIDADLSGTGLARDVVSQYPYVAQILDRLN